MTTRLSAVIFILFSLPAFVLAAGIDSSLLENYKITGYSRPCCTFARSNLQEKLGVAGIIDKDKLGEHEFARTDKKDKVGILYTCHGGFVDVSHLRDNADWSAHIFLKLPEWLNSGSDILARREGGFSKRSVYFPKMDIKDINSLTEDDLEKLAVSIGFSMALMHEIPTSFKIPVSVPSAFFITERSSAFSLEDAYSNLMGNYLGVKAARSSLPYNVAMTEILNYTLEELGAQSFNQTAEAYELVRNKWWMSGMKNSFKKLMKRDFTFAGAVTPFLVKNAPFCEESQSQNLLIPEKLSNGKSVHDYYEVRGVLKKNLKHALNKYDAKMDGTITQKDFPKIIHAIRDGFKKKLGANIEVRD